MDTTPVSELIEHLQSLDPADAPGPAEELADRLAAKLDEADERPPADRPGDPS